MITESNELWHIIQIRLFPGAIIPNWTALKGYIGDAMRVVEVDDLEIVVQSPKAKNLQHISRAEFEAVWALWPAYKAGRVQRQQIRALTFHSKYIISVLHWLEINHSR